MRSLLAAARSERLKNWMPRMVGALLLLGYAARVWSLAESTSPRQHHDTQFYFRYSQESWFSEDVWSGPRAPVPVLVFKLFDSDPHAIRVFFLVLTALAWSGLAIAVASSLRISWLKTVTIALTLSLALSDDVFQWTGATLSESLAVSLTALFVAAGLSFVRQPRRYAATFALAGLMLALCRDTSAYIVLIIGVSLGLLAIWFARSRLARPASLVAACLVIAFLASDLSASKGERWVFPLGNIIVWRVLTDDDATKEFVALGMPESSALRPNRPRRVYSTEKELAGFRRWVRTEGKGAYLRYLASHPLYFLGAPLAEPENVLGARLTRYWPNRFEPAEPAVLQKLWAQASWAVQLGVAGILAAVCLLWRRGRTSGIAITGLGLLVLVYPHILVIWHGDAMEVGRHGLTAAIQLRLALLLLLVGLADVLACWVADRQNESARIGRPPDRPNGHDLPIK